MKKSTIIAWVAFFSAIAGALAAAYFYIQRREQELDEYENLLFSEDFSEESDDDDVEDEQIESEEI
ncbi:MAG: phosphatase [Oscillospiraceae bacterium]